MCFLITLSERSRLTAADQLISLIIFRNWIQETTNCAAQSRAVALWPLPGICHPGQSKFRQTNCTWRIRNVLIYFIVYLGTLERPSAARFVREFRKSFLLNRLLKASSTNFFIEQNWILWRPPQVVDLETFAGATDGRRFECLPFSVCLNFRRKRLN